MSTSFASFACRIGVGAWMALVCLAVAHAQAGGPGFGKAFMPIDKPLPLSQETPPAALAEDAEVVLISGYEPSQPLTRVVVARPGKRVLLVLTSYQKMLWHVEVTPGTTMKGIVLSSLSGRSGVLSNAVDRVYAMSLPCALSREDDNFDRLRLGLSARLGVARVDTLWGGYALPGQIEIPEPGQARPAGALQSAPPVPAPFVFDFELLGRDLRPRLYRSTGPRESSTSGEALHVGGKVVLSRSGKTAYALHDRGLRVTDLQTNEVTEVVLPVNFPEFSWPTDLAHDPDQDLVSVVTLGGEGYLYRYDARRRTWLDYRSVNDVDIMSLAYDSGGQRHVAWTSNGELLFISKNGDLLAKRRVVAKLQGFERLYGDGYQRSSLRLVPRGAQVAFVRLEGTVVSHIWTYDEKTDAAALTYKRGVPVAGEGQR